MHKTFDVPLINPKRSATTIAYVYKHTAPNGKSYIGQTTQDPNTRWAQHVGTYGGCPAFENAIKKYGHESFTHEILIKINENMVDYYEALFIDLYNTKVPNGYNLKDGGNGGTCTDELRAKMRAGNDKKIENKNWKYEHHPKMKYVSWKCGTNKQGVSFEGYRVADHPNGRARLFSKVSMTIDERYQAAVEYKTFLDSYNGYYVGRDNLPQYISVYKTTGYKVRYPGVGRKYYHTGDTTADKMSAYKYLRSVCPEDKLAIVFRDCDIPDKDVV